MGYDYKRIESLIDQSGLTRKVFFSQTGISESYFNSWKSGAVVPRADVMQRIANKLGVSIQELQYSSQSKEKNTPVTKLAPNTAKTDKPSPKTMRPKRQIPKSSVSTYIEKNIETYLHATANKERHSAASHLRQRMYRGQAQRVTEEKLLSASDPERTQLLMLLFYLNRECYIRFCLDTLAKNNISLVDVAFFKRLEGNPLTDNEEKEVAKHIISCPKYDIKLLDYLHGENLDCALDGILQYSLEKGLTPKRLRTLSYKKEYLDQVQERIRNDICKNPNAYKQWIRFLDLSIPENQRIIQENYELIQIYSQLRNTQTDYYESIYFKVRIVQRILHRLSLESEDWYEIKLIILQEISINNIDENEIIINFLRDAYYLDTAFAESMLIALYKKTTLYTRSVLDILASYKSSFAYREMISILLSTKDRNERFRTARNLVKFYPNKSSSILDYTESLNDDDLLRQVTTDINTDNQENILESLHASADHNSKVQLIPRTVQINELLIDLAKQINADTLFMAVGFAFASGIRTLLPLIRHVKQNRGQVELVVGSLQNFNAGQNSRIDKATVQLLNNLIQKDEIKLFTHENSFYHGKYYYLGSPSQAYVIIGSSNISKTAFLDNFELDMLLEVDPESDNTFRNWYETFKLECTPIPLLNEMNFIDLKWDSELDVYAEKFIRKMSISEITEVVNELSDEEVKNRILTWLKYNPSDCFTDLRIDALDGYTLFIYEEYSLGVFESFSRDNAYYVFNCISVEQLLAQVAQLSKTQMANINIFVGKGYHIQNQDRLQDKIAKYFVRNSLIL